MGLDILVWIFHISTSNIACHFFTTRDDLYIPHSYMDFFLCIEKLLQKERHPTIDFPTSPNAYHHVTFIPVRVTWG